MSTPCTNDTCACQPCACGPNCQCGEGCACNAPSQATAQPASQD